MPFKDLKQIKIKLDLQQELKNIIKKDNQYTIPIFIPHKGCKNECVFCNQRKISGETKNVSFDDVDKIISDNLNYFDKNTNKKIEVAFFGGSFTGIKITDQIGYLKIANKYLQEGKIDSIRLSTRPDYINKKILEMLKKYNVGTIELGVQSLNDNVLIASKRGHDKNCVLRASRLIRLFNINLGHQIMIGLPESNKQIEIDTIKQILSLRPSQLRIYPVYVIEPSELYNMYLNNEYRPLTLDQSIDRTYAVMKECQKTDVKVIRIGLQSTDEITVKNKTVVGPVCDNFAEYVLAIIIRESVKEKLANIDIKGRNILIEVPNKYISITIGPKQINKLYFEEKYNCIYKVVGYKGV